MSARVNDVIQLDPEHCEWGALLCIVDKTADWGVQCYALIPDKRDAPPSAMYLRVRHEHYVNIGRVEWALGYTSEEDKP